jgi:hypothetical protein
MKGRGVNDSAMTNTHVIMKPWSKSGVTAAPTLCDVEKMEYHSPAT